MTDVLVVDYEDQANLIEKKLGSMGDVDSYNSFPALESSDVSLDDYDWAIFNPSSLDLVDDASSYFTEETTTVVHSAIPVDEYPEDMRESFEQADYSIDLNSADGNTFSKIRELKLRDCILEFNS